MTLILGWKNKKQPSCPIELDLEAGDLVSVIFISNKSIIMKIKEWYHVSLTSNISAKTWSNCTCRGCFEIVRTCRFQNWPWFWKSSKICGSNRAKQNTTDFSARLYILDRFASDYVMSSFSVMQCSVIFVVNLIITWQTLVQGVQIYMIYFSKQLYIQDRSGRIVQF